MKKLRALGIPGIKYFDGGSRGPVQWIAKHPKGGEWSFPSRDEALAHIKRNPEYSLIEPVRTHNFVIFDPDIAKILKRE